MIGIRKANPVISHGAYKTLQNDNEQVFTFMRYDNRKKIIVAVNLSDKPVDTNISLKQKNGPLKVLNGVDMPQLTNTTMALHLPAYGVAVFAM
jgi:glycosidase